MEGVAFDAVLSLVMFASFVFFYARNKEQRVPIFALAVVAIFWLYFGAVVGPKIADVSGVLFYSTKAITDVFTAVMFMVLYVNLEEDSGKFPLCKYLAYIFWANFGVNVLSAIEFNTSYAIMHNMYGVVVTILNIAQVVILFKGVQGYVSRHGKSGHNFVSNRAEHGDHNVVLSSGSGDGEKKNSQENKK